MKTNPNDPAQPTKVDAESYVKQFSIHEISPVEHHAVGLTKREHFAAMAMQGFINTGHVRVDHKSGTIENLYNYAVIAKSCVEQADALIKALNNEEQP